MSRLFIAYMGSVMLRSIGIAVIAGICSWRVRNVAIRHAAWVMVLAAMVSMPLIDYFLPPAWVPIRIQQILSQHSETLPAVSLKTAGVVQNDQREVPTAAARPVSEVQPPLWDWWRIALALYVLVAFAMLARLAMGYRKIWRLRAAGQWIPDAWSPEVEQLQPRWRVPVLLESRAVQVPMTIGFFRPAIVLPVSWQLWDEWKLRAVLLHEMAHVRRGDWGFAAIATLARCIYWFNPLSWYLERRLSELAEKASDDASLSGTRNTTQYAEILLEFAAAAQKGGRVMKRGIAMAHYKMQSRIERVLGNSKPSSGIMKSAGWTLIVILAVPVIYSAAAVQVASQGAPPITPAPAPVRAQSTSFQAAPVVEAPPKVQTQSPDAGTRKFLESIEHKVKQQSTELQQNLVEAQLARSLEVQEVPNRADRVATSAFMIEELLKLQAQMKALEAQKDSEKSKLSPSATAESTRAAQSQLAVLEAQQQALGQKLVEVEVAAARQGYVERQKPQEAAPVGEYRIKSGDVISVFVFKYPDLNAKARVLPDGRVSTPLVQSIKAAGLTAGELKAAIEARLGQVIDMPDVTVMLESISVEQR